MAAGVQLLRSQLQHKRRWRKQPPPRHQIQAGMEGVLLLLLLHFQLQGHRQGCVLEAVHVAWPQQQWLQWWEVLQDERRQQQQLQEWALLWQGLWR